MVKLRQEPNWLFVSSLYLLSTNYSLTTSTVLLSYCRSDILYCSPGIFSFEQATIFHFKCFVVRLLYLVLYRPAYPSTHTLTHPLLGRSTHAHTHRQHAVLPNITLRSEFLASRGRPSASYDSIISSFFLLIIIATIILRCTKLRKYFLPSWLYRYCNCTKLRKYFISWL